MTCPACEDGSPGLGTGCLHTQKTDTAEAALLTPGGTKMTYETYVQRSNRDDVFGRGTRLTERVQKDLGA